MSLLVAVQMDPIENISISQDSTFSLMLEAQSRNHQLFYYQPRDLFLKKEKLFAFGYRLAVQNKKGDHFRISDPEQLDLSACDVLLMRQDPPFDLAYITATHLLEHILEDVLIVNDPIAVRNDPEKILVTHYPKLTPPTLITRNLRALEDFRKEHKNIILKPLYGNGGAGVFKVLEEDENFYALVEFFLQSAREPFIAQHYVPEVKAGDKRILLVDGTPVGAFNRLPKAGESRSNMHVGGTPVATQLTERDREICATIGPDLKDKGLLFAGIDVIGGYLTEINVTSPTGIQEVKAFGGKDVAALLWDTIEEKVKK